MKNSNENKVSRRQFVKKTGLGVATTTVAINAPFIITAHAAPDDPINIGLVGCGGRGTGAALDAVNAATNVIYPDSGYHTEDAIEGAKVAAKNVKIVAMADVFEDRLMSSRQQLQKVGMEVNKENCFIGFDAYQKLMAIPEINYVILATPPHFRPLHLRAAVEAGKNVFMEKPAAVDSAGVRSIIESGEIARQKGLTIGAGTQRRRDNSYRELVKRIHNGDIGDIHSGVARWLGGELWYIDPQAGWSDMEVQLRNWNYYTWLSGDFIVEQFVHSLDLVNWVLQSHPTKAIGLGGRQVRTDPDKHGNIYDHFSVQYEYPNDVTIFCLDRQINGCANHVDDEFIGINGRANFSYRKTGVNVKEGKSWRFRGERNNPYQLEHDELIQSIRTGNPINEAQQVAESTLTAIMGREAVYSGQEIDWETALNSEQDLTLEKYEFGDLPVAPVPLPGKYRFV
ncbi:MAG: Gfo/Idh/MocA family oxidoreductase [Cyclobacteriaceae bacterium]|nr:Gfo/Idh/MocA family oxidoreductase [Cyclobacteriaceae bacterium]